MCDFHTDLPPLDADEYHLNTPRVRGFVADVRERIARAASPADACDLISPLFAELLGDAAWLPTAFQEPAPESGMGGAGRLESLRRRPLAPGDFYRLLPPRDDVHRVRTTSDHTSVSIHLLANDTGCVWRHTYDERTGETSPFRSGYVNAECVAE